MSPVECRRDVKHYFWIDGRDEEKGEFKEGSLTLEPIFVQKGEKIVLNVEFNFRSDV